MGSDCKFDASVNKNFEAACYVYVCQIKFFLENCFKYLRENSWLVVIYHGLVN